MGAGLAGSQDELEGGRLGCDCGPGGHVLVSHRGRAVGPGLPSPVCLLMSWWFTCCAEEGLCSLPAPCCVWGRRAQVSPGAAAGCGQWLCPEEGRAVGWVSCSSAAPCLLWVRGLGSGTGMFMQVWGAAVREGGMVLGRQLGRCSCCCPCPVIPRFCLLVMEGFHSAALGPSVCPIQQGWGSGRLGGGVPSSQLGLHLQGTERKGFGSLRYKREQGAPRPSCLQ